MATYSAPSGASPRETRPSAASPSSLRSWWADAMHNRFIALVLAMIVAVPLFAAPADRNLTGIAALTIQVFAVVMLTMLLWRAKWDFSPEGMRRFFTTGANAPILGFMALVGISAALSPHQLLSVQEFLRVGAGVLLYFVAAYQFRQSKHLSMLSSVLLFLCGMVAFAGMAQYQLFDEARARALFGDPQALGSFIMLLLPVVVALAVTDKNPRRRMAAQVVAVLMVGCLLLTQGRSAWLGAVAGLLTFGFLATRPLEGQKSQKNSTPLRARKHLIVAPLMIVLIAAGFIGMLKTQNASIGDRAATLNAASLSTDMSWQSRVQDHWAGTVEMIQAKPLFGWGAGLFPVYQHPFTGQGTPIQGDVASTRTSLAEQAHNFYLQTAAELGVFGPLLVIGILVTFWVAGFKKLPRLEAGIRRTLLMGSLAASVAFAVDAIGSPSWQYGQTSMFFWLMLGVGTSCLRPRVKTEEVVEAPVASRRVSWIARPAAVAACLMLATMLPTTAISAQSFSYNSGGGDNDEFEEIAFGVGLFYLLYSVADNRGGNGGEPDTVPAVNTAPPVLYVVPQPPTTAPTP